MYKYYAVLTFHIVNKLKRLNEGDVNKCTLRPRVYPIGSTYYSRPAPPLSQMK